MSHIKPEEFIPFAEQLANISGEIIRRYYKKKIPIEIKADDSPVTKADKEVERNIRAIIRTTYPEHGIIGEEYEAINPDAEYKWVIDPIDGTKSFMIGRPIFGTLITLLRNNEPLLGVIDQPILGERWTGVKGFATNFNYEEAKTRECKKIGNAILCTTSPHLFDEEDFLKFEQVRRLCQYSVYGGDCYSYGLLANGFVDVVIETGLKPYDFCALAPIIEGARGIITDWEGKRLNFESDGKVIASGDIRTHAQILELIKSKNL